MRIYLVHVAPEAGQADPDPVIVKDGFAVFAFLFTVFWALWHRMWFVAAAILVGWLLLEGLYQLIGASDELRILVSLAYSAFVGFGANDWLSASLVRRGYRLAGVVAASRVDAALRRWFDLRELAGA